MSYNPYAPAVGYPYAAAQQQQYAAMQQRPVYAVPQYVAPQYAVQPQQAYGYPASQAAPYNAAYATSMGLNNNPATSLFTQNRYAGFAPQQQYPQVSAYGQNPYAAYSAPQPNPLASLFAQPTYVAPQANPLAALFSQNPYTSVGATGTASNPLAALLGQNVTFSSTPTAGTNLLPIILRQAAPQTPAAPAQDNTLMNFLQMLLLSKIFDGALEDIPAPAPEPILNWDLPNWLNSNGANGNVWGDPHFKDLTNTAASKTAIDYDVMGAAGKNYSMISDKNIQFNSQFKKWGRDDVTVNGTAAFKLKTDDGKEVRVLLDAEKDTPTVNGEALKDGETRSFKVDGKDATVAFKNKVLTVKTSEYAIEALDQGTYLDYNVAVQKDGVFSDKVNPHGLLGQTADGDTNIRKGKTGAGAQGEGAIDLKVTDYEVKDLFDDPKAFINRYGVKTRAVGDAEGKVKAVYDDKDNLIAAKDKEGKLVSVRRVDDGKGGTIQTLSDGKTKVDNKGDIVKDAAAK